MANYSTLKAAIQTVIKQNGNNEITGELLQQSLLSMITSLGASYQYAGIATPSTNPGTPDQNIFYLASSAGTYTNFDGLVLADGEIAILKYNGTWSKDSTRAATAEQVSRLSQKVEPLGQGTIAIGTAADVGLTITLSMPVRKLTLYLDSTGGGALVLYFRNAASQNILTKTGYAGWNTYTFESDVTQVWFRNRVLTTEDIHISMYSDDSIPYIIKERFPKTIKSTDVTFVPIAARNLVNPDSISLNKGFDADGIIVDANGYSITDFIRVNKKDIIANAFVSQNWAAFVVYDEQFYTLRVVKNSNQYTYQDGDVYVRIMLNGVSGPALRANYGSTLNGFVEYNPIDEYLGDIDNEINALYESVDVINDENETGTRVLTGSGINADGNVVPLAGNTANVNKYRVTPFENYVLVKVRSIVNVSGVFFKYAWYSSYDVINEGTFISGESANGPFDITTENGEIVPPAGALALVVCSYGAEIVTKKQNTINSISQLYFKRNVIEKGFNYSMREIKNGEQKIFGTAFSFKGYGLAPHPSGLSPYENMMSLANLGWCYFGPFNPGVDELIYVEFDVIRYSVTGTNVNLYVAKNYASSGATQQNVGEITGPGHYKFIIDPTFYRVHKGFSDVFYIWIHKINGVLNDCTIKNMKIYSVLNGVALTNISGTDVSDMMESIDNSIGQLYDLTGKEEFLISPDGRKYILAVNNDGTLKTIPVIPNKAAFFGNSLMFGNIYFGMDATAEDKDFYARINAFIGTLNPNYSPARYSAVPFETIASLENVDGVIQSTIANLNGDEDLVIIQAGDNVTNEQATEILPTSSLALLAALKNKCPNARICWPAIWYSTSEKMNAIRNACERYGVLLIPINDLNTPENAGYVGAIIDYGVGRSVTNTLTDVSSIVENTSNNITVTFTYSGNVYTKTIDVESYNLDGTTLTYTGRYRISTTGAGHPGDIGMKAIANRILFSLGICDDENAYPLD